jgi:hypothetical protein
MFPASVDHIWEMLSVLTNLNDALEDMVCILDLSLRDIYLNVSLLRLAYDFQSRITPHQM